MRKSFAPLNPGELAAIQYVGMEGDSLLCVDAVRRLLTLPERPNRIVLVTAEHSHGFLFDFDRDGLVAVRNGFSSGYRGTGPKALADALVVLRAANLDVEEVVVSPQVLQRLSVSALTREDLDLVEKSRPVRPTRIHDYIYDFYQSLESPQHVWNHFDPVMPYGILDPRLAQRALGFRGSPDQALMDGFRMLEEAVRARAELDEHGSKLFSLAFAGDESKLYWVKPQRGKGSRPEPIDRGEQAGRAQMFTGAYQAFRNPRAHRTLEHDLPTALSEFLVLNQLFRFEAEAVTRPAKAESPS